MKTNKKQTKNFKVDFIIPGVMKGGTTSARYYLEQHPKLYLSPRETGFFTEEYFHKGLSWYKDQFKIPKAFTGLIGEKTPRYCVSPGALDRIKKTLPDVKLIMFLRDPVTRMYSHWNHNRVANERQRHHNYVAFDEYISKKKHSFSNPFNSGPYNPYNRGKYVEQLKNIVEKFGKEKLHVVISERCKGNILEEYNKIFNFLGVSELSESDIKYKDVHMKPYVTTMQEKERDCLREFFKPYNEQLFEFLGYEIDEWL